MTLVALELLLRRRSAAGSLLVTYEELRDAGVSRDATLRAVRSGRLHRHHRTVYSIGRPDLPFPWAIKAAVLAVGPDTLASDRAAAQLWGIVNPRRLLTEAVDVTVSGPRRRSRRGIRVHHRQVDPRDRRTRRGIALTSPARTIVDLAAQLDVDDLEQLVVEADIRRLATADELRTVIARASGQRGTRRFIDLLDRAAWQGLTRSQAERRALELVARARLPRPRVNPVRLEHRIDLHWPQERLVLEIDGFATHGRRRAFDDDHDRDLTLEIAGEHVMRATANQLTRTPEAVVAAIASELARRAG